MKTLTRWFVAAALCAAFAFAQGPGRGTPGGDRPDPATMIQRRVDHLATQLSLTDAQKASAITIFTDAQTASQDARANQQSTSESLADAVKRNDASAIDQLAGTLGTIQGRVLAINSKSEAAFYALLTPDQKTKYDGMRGPRGGMGPGGMGPGGMGPRPSRRGPPDR